MNFKVRIGHLLDQITYKDWAIIVAESDPGRYYLQTRFAAPDNSTGEVESWSGRKWQLSTHMTDSEIVQTALKAVLTAEEHEAREKFLYRGRAIFGPHIDVGRLWELTEGESALDVRQAA